MLECFHCGKKITNELKMVMIGADGDFVCNKECEAEFKKERDHFFNVIVHSPEKTEAYLRGKDV